MAILVRYTPAGMTAEQYDNVGRKLEDGGDWPPQGLLAHVCFGSSGNLHVSEVWESRDLQEQFAQTLRPYLEEANVDLSGEPEYLDVRALVPRSQQRIRRLRPQTGREPPPVAQAPSCERLTVGALTGTSTLRCASVPE